jgi:hypothetical protein
MSPEVKELQMLKQRYHMYLNTLRVYVYSYYFKMDTWT